jgi:hypothetical protein
LVPPSGGPEVGQARNGFVFNADFAHLDGIAEQIARDDDLTLKVLVVALGRVHGHHVGEIIDGMRPDIVIDLRNVARFDMPGSNRQTFFTHIDAVKSHYRMEPVPWHQLSNIDLVDSRWMPSSRVMHELLFEKNRSVLLLTGRSEHARSLASVLNRALTAKSHRDFRLMLVA